MQKTGLWFPSICVDVIFLIFFHRCKTGPAEYISKITHVESVCVCIKILNEV